MPNAIAEVAKTCSSGHEYRGARGLQSLGYLAVLGESICWLAGKISVV